MRCLCPISLFHMLCRLPLFHLFLDACDWYYGICCVISCHLPVHAICILSVLCDTCGYILFSSDVCGAWSIILISSTLYAVFISSGLGGACLWYCYYIHCLPLGAIFILSTACSVFGYIIPSATSGICEDIVSFAASGIHECLFHLDDIFFWKGPESIHSFRFKRMSNEDIVTYLYLIDTIMIYWVWNSFNWKNQPHIFLYQRQIWLINLLSRVSLSRTGRIPAWCLSIRMTTKIIIV